MEKFLWGAGSAVAVCCMVLCLLYCLTAQTAVSFIMLLAVCVVGYFFVNKMPTWLR